METFMVLLEVLMMSILKAWQQCQERISMIKLFKHLVKVTVGSLVLAVALNWYSHHQDVVTGMLKRAQFIVALIQAAE